jgi:hypothetical protein
MVVTGGFQSFWATRMGGCCGLALATGFDDLEMADFRTIPQRRARGRAISSFRGLVIRSLDIV